MSSSLSTDLKVRMVLNGSWFFKVLKVLNLKVLNLLDGFWILVFQSPKGFEKSQVHCIGSHRSVRHKTINIILHQPQDTVHTRHISRNSKEQKLGETSDYLRSNISN